MMMSVLCSGSGGSTVTSLPSFYPHIVVSIFSLKLKSLFLLPWRGLELMTVVSPNTDNHPVVADSGIKKNSKLKHDTYLSLLNKRSWINFELNTETSSSHRVFSRLSVQRRCFRVITGECSQDEVMWRCFYFNMPSLLLFLLLV